MTRVAEHTWVEDLQIVLHVEKVGHVKLIQIGGILRRQEERENCSRSQAGKRVELLYVEDKCVLLADAHTHTHTFCPFFSCLNIHTHTHTHVLSLSHA